MGSLADLRALAEQRRGLVRALNGEMISGESASEILTRWDALVEVAEAAQALFAQLEAEDDPRWDGVAIYDRLAAALAGLGITAEETSR